MDLCWEEILETGPLCILIDSPAVGHLVANGDQVMKVVSSANLMMVLRLWVAMQSCVRWEHNESHVDK